MTFNKFNKFTFKFENLVVDYIVIDSVFDIHDNNWN